MTVIVNKLAINYHDEGKGKVILLLHGWQSNLQSLYGIAKHLKNKYRVVLLDLPGFGKSESPKEDWDLDDYIHLVEAFLAKLKIKKLHGLIAHSMGCRIAIKAVGVGQVQTDKLVLIGAHGIRESQTFRNRLFWLAAKTGRIVTKPLPEKYRQALKERLYKTAGSTDYINAGKLKKIFTNIINEDVRPEAAMINVPTLLIYGKNDTVTPPHYGKAFQKLIGGSKLEIIPEGGHYVYLDQPQKVNYIVKQFIS